MPRTGNAPPMVQVHFSWRMLTLLAVLLVGPWLLVALMVLGSRRGSAHVVSPQVESAEKTEAGVTQGKAGPWGNLDYVPITIELPDEFVTLPVRNPPPIRWFFPDFSKDKVTALVRSAGLTSAQLDAVLTKGTWSETPQGTSLTPGDEWIVGLSPASRQILYARLVEPPQNAEVIAPVAFGPGQLEARLDESDLTDASIRVLKGLLYQSPSAPSLTLFADLELALHRLGNEQEQRRFVKAISRKTTLLARLKIDADSDVEELASYWGVGGRRKDIAPLLNSLRRVDGGCAINVVYLLPRFVREHLYNHPFSTVNPQVAKQDCFWSTFNIFNEEADDRFNDMQYVRQVLERDYYSIQEPSRLGDVVFLAVGEQTVVHAAAYVADDVVFTKNGAACTQPWILMHLQDMIDVYSVRYPVSGPVKVLCFRRKTL
jgi:hypothetical protein